MNPIYLIPSSAVFVMGTHVGAGENLKLANFPKTNQTYFISGLTIEHEAYFSWRLTEDSLRVRIYPPQTLNENSAETMNEAIFG